MPEIVWQFVDSPSADANVLLDMNQSYGGNKIVLNMGRGFDISPPDLKRSFAVNAMVDGGRLTSSAFDNRILKFSVSLQGTVEEKIANLGLLTRQLAKSENLIMYTPKPGQIDPVFFRTFRSDEYTTPPNRSERGAWHVDCEVVAEPYALGERIQIITELLTSNDPGAPSNGQRIDFPDIIGDGPSPAFVHIETGQAENFRYNNAFYLSSRTRDNAGFTHIHQFVADDANDADTASFASVTASGGTALRTTFATDNTLKSRATALWLNEIDSDSWKGRYRVLLRVHSSVVPSTFAVRIGYWFNGMESKLITWEADTTLYWQHLDFGIISWPMYETPDKIGYSGLQASHDGLFMDVDVQRLSGTGNFEFDYISLLPADESTVIASRQQYITHLILDGPNEKVYGTFFGDPFNPATSQAGEIYNNNGMMPWRGAIPDLIPGAPNTWYYTSMETDPPGDFTFNVHYWPKWREVATP